MPKLMQLRRLPPIESESMTPAEIMRAEPGMWPSTRDISVALQRIRRKLRKDDTLRKMFGL